MAKIVLDPEESGIEAFAKPFFSARRNMGLRTKRRVKHSKTPLRQQKMLRPRKDAPGIIRMNTSSCE